MSQLVCITNDMDDVRSCVEHGQHLQPFCDGDEYRSRLVWDEEQRREVYIRTATGNKCAGCLPKLAGHGLGVLCTSCFRKTGDAIGITVDMVTHLRSVARAQQTDNAGVRSASGWVIPVPASWRMADEMLMLLGGPLNGFPSTADVDDVRHIIEDWAFPNIAGWVSTFNGAEDAVRFYRLMQNALAQHPMKEYSHRVVNVRCYKCSQRSLLWQPPLMFEGQVRVVCTNPKCGAQVDQTMYERLALIQDPKSRWARKKISGDDNVEPIIEDEQEVVQS